jgi:siroheme synthase-like protein
VFLKLSGRPVVVVGGGGVAVEKVAVLRPTGAHITIIAPEIAPDLIGSDVTLIQRRVRASDLAEAWFIVSAATPEVNQWVAQVAGTRHVFVNAVDDPANATAYLGGVVRRNGVTVAISTAGRAPALAALLRRAIDALLPGDLARWFEESDRLRQEWRSQAVPWGERRPQLARAIASLYAEETTDSSTGVRP